MRIGIVFQDFEQGDRAVWCGCSTDEQCMYCEGEKDVIVKREDLSPCLYCGVKCDGDTCSEACSEALRADDARMDSWDDADHPYGLESASETLGFAHDPDEEDGEEL